MSLSRILVNFHCDFSASSFAEAVTPPNKLNIIAALNTKLKIRFIDQKPLPAFL